VLDKSIEMLNLGFLKKLEALSFIDAVYLYGSRARGDAKERSDIDLAIEAPKATQENWNQIHAIIENADTLLKIDCVDLGNVKSEKFLENILRDKVILYQRKHST